MLLGHVTQGEHKAVDGLVVSQVAAAHLNHGRAAVEPLDLQHVPGRLPTRVALSKAEGEHQVEHAVDVLSRTRRHEVDQRRTLDGDIAEYVGRGRGGIPDPAVVADDEDDVGGVLDEGAEQCLAALADHLLRESEPLDGQGRLPGEDLKHRGEVVERAPVAEELEQPDERVADRPVLEDERATAARPR